MSNKIVHDIYRGVIHDVSSNVKYDFEEMGIEDVVLQELLRIWQNKLDDTNSHQEASTDDSILQSLIHQQQSLQQQGKTGESSNLDDFEEDKKGVKEDTKKDTNEDDDNAINSDLDDDDDDDNDLDSNDDIVLCLYDKVQRVKNKWRMQLKDGIISINNKDYLFSKCSGEFEW